MRFNRNTIHTLFVLSLPIIVAIFGLGIAAAVTLVIVTLLWRWALSLSRLMSKPGGPDLVLESISASHFVEKVRWCMDELGVPYEEQHNAGTFGAFFAGRTVPRLHVRDGNSVIGNSSTILRYLWGRYVAEYGDRAAFLKPTAETVALEADIDRYGVLMQQWIYYHILSDRSLSLQVWGFRDTSLPAWQRAIIFVAFPLIKVLMQRSFRISPQSHPRTIEKTETFLQQIEDRLADGRETLLDGDRSFADITLAALSGVWVWPENYGGGKAEAVRPEFDDFPQSLQSDVIRWKTRYPLVTAFVERQYENRQSS